jgi:NTP pyrophosphatase (non-canonical NTP hydrolase)
MQQQIINHYGYENQLKKLIEELRELEEVILYHRYDEEHIKEEMADVLNLIEQISVFQGWSEDINEIKEFKINRQLDRIQRGE